MATITVGASGDYATIQAAIDNANNGDVIQIAAGSYEENLTITEGVTLQGEDGVVLTCASGNNITITGDLDASDVTISGIDIVGVAGAGSTGVAVYVTEGADVGTLTLDGVNISNAGAWGVFVNGDDTMNALAKFVCTDSTFADVGYNGVNGSGAIKLYGFVGDATISDVTITGADGAGLLTTWPDYAIELTGRPNAYLTGSTAVPDLGTITITNVDVDGYFHKNPVAFANYDDVSGLSISNLDLLDIISNWGPLFNMDGITSDFDATGFGILLPASGIVTEIQGDVLNEIDADQDITGTGFNDRVMGKGGNDTLHGGAGNDELYGADKPGGAQAGEGGDDVLDGGAGDDLLFGGAGTDTASYAGTVSIASNAGAWQVDDGPNGVDTLDGVEKVQSASGTTLLVGAGGYATIQDAIDASVAGDTILIAAGTYSENVNVNVSGITIVAEDGAQLVGSFLTDNGFNEHVDVELRTAPAYSGAAGAGLTISADDVTIRNLSISAFLTAVELGNGSDGLTLDGLTITDVVNGVRKGTAAEISDFTMLGGLIQHSTYGFNIAQAIGAGSFDGVTVDGVAFEHLQEKGMYFEALSNALFTNLTMTDVGQYGRGPAFGGTGANQGGFGAGVDVNLKYGEYSKITFDGFTFTDVGSSTGTLSGDPHAFGGAFTIKARDDGAYSGSPASFDGAIVITNGTISGTSTAIRAGEPGKNNGGPDVDVSNVDISGSISHDFDNQGLGVLSVDGTADADAILTNPASVGAFSIDAAGGDDTVLGGGGKDTIDGGAGDDIIDGGSGIDTAVFSGPLASLTAIGGEWHVDGGDGDDVLANVEIVQSADGNTLLVGEGGFATIQEAIDAAQEGDTIRIAAGTYEENVNVHVDGISIVAEAGAVLKGSFKSDNGIADDASVAEFLEDAVAYTGAAGAGLTINASNVSITGLAIDSFLHGVQFGSDSTGGDLSGLTITDSVFGYYKLGSTDLDGLHITGGSISDGYMGVYMEKIVDGTTNGSASNIVIDGLSFTDLADKGIYAEALSNSDLLNLIMNHVGYWGKSPAFGGAHAGAGIEINLKSGTYSGINIEGFDFTDVGSADHNNSGAILVKVRDDGPSYSTHPGVYEGELTISNGSIDGTTTGIRAGESGKFVGGPAVVVDGVDITNAIHDSFRGDVDNVSQATMDIVLNDDANSLYAKEGATGAFNITAGGGDDTVSAGSANDTIDGGAGDDILMGGAGIDTAKFSGPIANISAAGGEWQVQAGDGLDTLIGIERLETSDGNVLLVGEGGFATIQEAIDAAEEGDTIRIAAGTYSENVTIDVDGLTIIADDGAELVGSFMTDNGFDEHVDVELQTAGAYTGAAGSGLTIAADNVTIQGLRIAEFLTGIELGNGVDGLTLQDIEIEDTVDGLRKGTAADVSNLSIIGGLIHHSVHGFTAYEAPGVGSLDGVTMDGTVFEHLMAKGLYFEALSNALFTNLVMTDVGVFGRGPAFGGTGPNLGGFGAGVDINLKHGTYENIVFDGFTFTDVGTSNGGGSEHAFGGAFTVKARDDGSYGSDPATITDAIVITNGTITGTSTAIRSGEPGKGNAGPDVDVSNVEISGATTGYDNASHGVFGVEGTDEADAIITNIASVGAFDIDAGGGDDSIGGGAGADTIAGGAGDDLIDGAGGVDTAAYAVSATVSQAFGGGWQVTAAGLGTDTLIDVEIVQSADGNVLLVGEGGFDSLQAALDAAQDGDVIQLAAGDYELSSTVTIDKNVTIRGFNAGVAGDADRTGDSEIDASGVATAFVLGPNATNVVFDGLRIIGDQVLEDTRAGLSVTFTNSVFELTTGAASAIHMGASDFVFTNNYVESTGASDGLLLLEGGAVTVSDNVFKGLSNLNLSFNATAINFSGGEGSFEGNTFDQMDIGILLSGNTTDPVLIDGNSFLNMVRGATANAGGSFGAGIVLYDPSYDDLITITDNTFENSDAGILASDHNDPNLDDFQFFIDGNVFTGNLHDVHSLADGTLRISNSVVDGFDADEVFIGGASGDSISGTDGDDYIAGGDGADTLAGGPGSDTLSGGAGVDTANFAGSTTSINLDLADGSSTNGFGAGANLLFADGPSGSDTLIGIENAIGTDLGDTMSGDAGDNRLEGGLGDDVLNGRAGNDTLIGAGGVDTVTYADAGAGVTVSLAGGSATGGAGTDSLSGIENVTGSAFADTLTGDGGDNILVGGGGADTIDGRGGRDTVSYASAGAGVVVNLDAGTVTGGDSDTLSNIENAVGSAFGDTFVSSQAANIFNGGLGSDTVSYASATGGVTVDLGAGTASGAGANTDTLISIENVIGSAFNDTFVGSSGNNTFDGRAGIDTVTFAAAAAGMNINLLGGSATGQGDDVLIGIENIIASAHNDTVVGNKGDNRLEGGAGNDKLSGLNGDDNLIGGAGDDELIGAQGNDTLDGGAGVDRVVYRAEGRGVQVDLGAGTATVGASQDTLSSIEDVEGSEFADVLLGAGGANFIHGFDGDDTIGGGAGADNLVGGGGVDMVTYANAGSGVIVNLQSGVAKGEGTDSLKNFEGVIGSAFNDALTGDNANNILKGGGGEDILTGGKGVDFLYGGAGADTFRFTGADDLAGVGDRIYDLENSDVIDLKGIDADTTRRGNQAFSLVDKFTGAAGEATLKYNANQDATYLRMDTDGDKSVDLTLRIQGDHHDFTNFVL